MVSVQAVAEMLNLSDRRVHQLVKDGVLPRSQKGKYDLVECGKSYIEYLNKKAAAANKSIEALNKELTQEKVLYERARRRKQEILTDALERKSHLAADVARVWSDMVAVTKARIMSLPSRILNDSRYLISDDKEMKRIVNKAVRDALTSLADYDPTAITPSIKDDALDDNDPGDGGGEDKE